jgi:hypothetical protein
MSWIPSDDYEYHNTTTTMEFEWGKDLEFYVDATIEWQLDGFDGIGLYEYHGQKCFDQGSPNWEIGTVSFTLYDENSNEVVLSEEAHAEIMDYIYSNAEPDFD